MVSIIMGSKSDLPIMKDAQMVFDVSQLNVPFELAIVSAHRTPQHMMDYASSAQKRGIKVIIAGAGGAAHLPGMVASFTVLPVIGVPIQTKTLNGLDSLLSIVQMPEGIPVATVAINNAKNAALLACRILALKDTVLLEKLSQYIKKMEKQVLDDAKKVFTCHSHHKK